MCLDVIKSHVRKPIKEALCTKVLEYAGRGRWMTPYREVVVPVGTGWFMPMRPATRQVREYHRREIIEGGYIHAYEEGRHHARAYTKLPSRPIVGGWYDFEAIARDVVAEGEYGDLVCRAIYIPAFDKTGEHRNAILDM